MSTNTPRGQRLSRRHVRERIMGYWFLLPDVVGLLVVVVGPIGFAFYASLHRWTALSPMRWIGFANYARLWSDVQFWISRQITALYAIFYAPTLLAMSLGLAVLIQFRFLRTRT